MKEKQLETQTFNRIIKFICIMGFTMCFIISLMRYFYTQEPLINISHALAFMLISGAGVFFIYKYKNYLVGSYGILFYFATIQPFHVYRTGGLYSFGLPWIIVIIPFAALFFPRKIFVTMTLWLSGCLFYMALNPVPLDPMYSSQEQLLARAITAVLSLVAICLIIRIAVKEREELKDRLIQLERENSISSLAVSMAHEINNPMAIAAGNMQLLKRKGMQNKYVDKIDNAHQRIIDVIKEFKDVAHSKDFEFEEYTKNVNMLKLGKNENVSNQEQKH